MDIYGLQKLTLLDYPGHTACTVFLAGCNMRCPFCHNYGLVDGSARMLMEEEGLFGFLSKRTKVLDGVAFTGGEPLLAPDLPRIMGRLKDMGFLVKLDTNGLLPDVLGRILREGLVDYVAMDVKNSPSNYARTAGMDFMDMDRIRQSIAVIMQNAPEYEFRTTVVKEFHGEKDMVGIGKLIDGAQRYFIQNFQNSDLVPRRDLTPHAPEALERFREIVSGHVGEVGIRGMG